MNIININSDIEITYSQKSFIEEVLSCGNEHNSHEENSFDLLSKQIPIFLLNEESMVKHDIESEYRYEENLNFKPHTEWLGFYGRDSAGLFEHTPRIAICPERIAKIVSSDEEFMFLLAKVIVHELAHAKMDFKDQNKKYKTKDLFWRWMEESSANRYTLEVFENFTQRNYSSRNHKNWNLTLFDFVVDFIKKQPPEYALGFELFEKRPTLNCEWERMKSDLGGSKRTEEKNDWLDYVQHNYKSIDSKKMSFLYDAIFNGKKEANQKNAKQLLKTKIQNNEIITQSDIQDVTDMGSLFHGVDNYTHDISQWDVSHVTNMGHMFKYSTFNPDISDWKVSSVTDMRLMFVDAEFSQDLSKWDISKVENMSRFMSDVDSVSDFKKKYSSNK